MTYRLTVLAPILLTSCASVTAVPLMANGMPDGTTKGLRYYLPKPYILVTELPVPAPAPQAARGTQGQGGAAGAGAAGGNGSGKDQSGKSSDSPQATTPTAPATDTSFSASMANYSVKLIYLPDYNHPMALQEESGLFGNVSLAPTFQDGWMLTSLSSLNDSGGAAALAAVASLVGSAVGGGASGGATKVASTKKTQTTPGVNIAGKNTPTVTVENGSTTTSLLPIPPIWGENVLPAGLYAFDYNSLQAGPNLPVLGQTPRDQQPGIGELHGLKPLMFFCAEGAEAPIPRSVPRGDQTITDLYDSPCVHPAGGGS